MKEIRILKQKETMEIFSQWSLVLESVEKLDNLFQRLTVECVLFVNRLLMSG